MGADQKISENINDHGLQNRITKLIVIFYFFIVATMFFINSDIDIISSSPALSSFGFIMQKQTHQGEKSGVNLQLSIEKNHEEEEEEENEENLIPPQNVTKQERMAWFRKNLPKYEILKSSYNSSSASFHLRVLSFLTQNCSTFFFAIWLSPAKNFCKRDFITFDTLFKVHPQGCLLILSRSMESKRGYRILKPLLDRGFKVQAITPDLPFLVKNTPAQSWLEGIKNGNRDPGSIPISQNLSNLMRLAMLYKYGGVYLDTDLIFVKDMSQLKNAIGAQFVDLETKQWLRLNSAIMIFDMKHPILLDLLEEFASSFDGNKWGHNGPYLVTRVVGRVVEDKLGYNLTVLPPSAFYPVDWNKIKDYYKKPTTDSGTTWVDNRFVELIYGGKTYALHLWNKKTRDLAIEEGSVMEKLFTDYCLTCSNFTRT
ncbi:hypothetical protein HN51_066492 [Arachis hypogaea]|uniref:Alpha 1,4-glycosyltransferase domain-containing protein n=1 Tax=Arachis hypogaea TaxID=3818 RepID=A0A444ZP09_ARAHY|nr:lactosylceramide 4-alpha-galactosyltransferase-like [Arachis hypogaea]RYR15939.1 hypothetical protein Ahy_B04g072906 [Arachis hypogaea]